MQQRDVKDIMNFQVAGQVQLVCNLAYLVCHLVWTNPLRQQFLCTRRFQSHILGAKQELITNLVDDFTSFLVGLRVHSARTAWPAPQLPAALQ